MQGRLQPVLGALKHCSLWVQSSGKDHFIKNPAFNKDSTRVTSIYCVHGTADRDQSFSVIADLIKGKLPDNIDGIHLLAFDDRAKGSSVEDYAKQLKDKIILNKSANVILMGHSRGGLVCSWFTEYLSQRNDIHVDLVISICGPFRGSYLAVWPLTALSASVNEMKADSDHVKELTVQIQKSSFRYLFVGAEGDWLVTGNSYLPYQIERKDISIIKVPQHGHLSMMSQPDNVVIDSIVSLIERAESQEFLSKYPIHQQATM